MHTRKGRLSRFCGILAVAFGAMLPLGAQEAGHPRTEGVVTLVETSFPIKMNTVASTSGRDFTAIGLPWQDLPGARLQYTLSGGKRVFAVTFTAECQKLGGESIRIRVLNIFDGRPQQTLQPNDDAMKFCSSAETGTHVAKWILETSVAKKHELQVQFLQFGGTAKIDDWTFELAVYNGLQ